MQTENSFDEIARHYNAISQHYDDWFSLPWPEPAIRQGALLNDILKTQGLPQPCRVLDLTCGVGTQAIGLAMHGHDVTAIDISPGQIAEAEKRAAKIQQELRIKFVTGNALNPQASAAGPFDAIISFGNSLPMLGTADAFMSCLKNCYGLLSENGVMLVSMKDHAEVRAEKKYVTASGKLENGDRRGVWVETADWSADGTQYKSNIIFVLTSPQHEQRHYAFPPVAALTADETQRIFMDSGYRNVECWPQNKNPGISFPIFKGQK